MTDEQPHPQNCETCNPKCDLWEKDIPKDGYYCIRLMLGAVTCMKGCASHSSATKPGKYCIHYRVCRSSDAKPCKDIKCPEYFSGSWSKTHNVATSQAAREEVLARLDKEIATKENELNRKASLEDNLTTITGYTTAASALNWVRVVLIDALRSGGK